jgi:hypothetical protein
MRIKVGKDGEKRASESRYNEGKKRTPTFETAVEVTSALPW